MTRYRCILRNILLGTGVPFVASLQSASGQSPQAPSPPQASQSAVVSSTEPPAAALIPPEMDARLSELLQQLSSSEFDRREQATEELLHLDSSYINPLKAVRDSSTDPEIRARLSGVVARLKFKWIEETARIFLRDPDMTQSHDLHGWRSFSRTAGATRKSKRLFVRLFETYPNLVETELTSERQALELALSIASNIEIREQNLSAAEPEDGLALLYCANLAGSLMDAGLVNKTLRVIPRAEFRTLITEPQSRKPIESMINEWALRTGDSRPMAMILMMEVDFAEVRQVALDYLDSPSAKEDPSSVLTAMEALYRFGRVDDLPRINPWLDDKSVCYEDIRTRLPDEFGPNVQPGSGPPPGYPKDLAPPPASPQRVNPAMGGSEEYSLEVRDVALLTSIKISSSDPREYFSTLITHPLRGFSARSIVLPKKGSDAFRQARIDQWRNSLKK